MDEQEIEVIQLQRTGSLQIHTHTCACTAFEKRRREAARFDQPPSCLSATPKLPKAAEFDGFKRRSGAPCAPALLSELRHGRGEQNASPRRINELQPPPPLRPS